MTENTITLNVWDVNKGFAMAVEGEKDSRYLKIKLIDNSGPIDLSEKLAQFLAKKPDGNIIYNTMDIIDALGGVVGLNITEQISAVPGVLEDCEINILDLSGKKLVAKKLDLLINPSTGQGVERSVSESTVVRELITKVANLEEHASSTNNPHDVTCAQVEAVPLTRKINNKELSEDITLTNEDVNAAATSHTHTMEDIQFSTLPISLGGTGANTAAGAVLNLKESLVDLIYPVGSYYYTSSSTSPEDLFGGTWEQIEDRFILAAGNTYSEGETGGEAKHFLSLSEIPKHRHKTGPDYIHGYGGLSGDVIQNGSGYCTTLDKISTDYAGGSGAHNNMPPYLVAYCWHRVG